MLFTNDMIRITLNSLIDERVACLTNNRKISINYRQYEEIIKKVLQDCSNGRYIDCEYTGNKSICFDTIFFDTQTNKKIALQVKSNNIDGNFTKIYEMSKITDILNSCNEAEEVLNELIQFYNDRYSKEKQDYGFEELQSLFIIKGEYSIFLYENHFNLDEFDTDLSKYEILRYKKGSYLHFQYGDNIYKFTFSNHTLCIKFVCDHNYIGCIASDKLKTYVEKANEVVDYVVANNINSTVDIPFSTKFHIHRNNLGELAKIMTSQSGMLSYNTSEIKRIPKSDMMYVDNKSGIFLLKDSIIQKTSKIYAELLNIKAISPKGRVLIDLQVENQTDLKKYFK